MEVTPNGNVQPAARALVDQTKTRAPQPGTDTAAFGRAAALEQALEMTPVVRSEMVARAQEHIGDVQYPPEQTIERIAKLLSMNLDHATDGSASFQA